MVRPLAPQSRCAVRWKEKPMNKKLESMGFRLLRLFSLVAAGLILTGCETPRTAGRAPDAAESILHELKQADRTSPASPGPSLPDTRVVLAAGDLIEVKFFFTPDLNESQQIRPDGHITLQLVGDIPAAGRTPAELQKTLEQKYTGLIENPSVAVIVRELNHRNVYVGGAVNEPGMLPMPGHMTALSAIMQAGGFDLREAKLKNVLVIRHQEGVRTVYSLDVRDALKGEAPPEPFYLHPQDIVYVPRTGIVHAGQWVEQHINRIIPQFGFTYLYNSGNTTIGYDTN